MNGVELIAALLFAYLAGVVPVRGRSRYEELRREVAKDPSARLRYYRRSMIWKWGLSVVVVMLFFANGQDPSGARLLRSGPTAAVLIVEIAVGLALGSALLYGRARRPASRAKLARGARGFADLLPRTAEERRAWVFVALTAGVTEELLYRGFVFSVLVHGFPGEDRFTLLAVGGAIFGLAHLYQGTKGVIVTALLGVVLGEVVLAAGLLAAMVVHTLLDLRLLVIPPDFVTQTIDRESGGSDPPGGS